jgi:hypothetical protein
MLGPGDFMMIQAMVKRGVRRKSTPAGAKAPTASPAS